MLNTFKNLFNKLLFKNENLEQNLEYAKMRIQNQKKEIRELKEKIKVEMRNGNPTSALQSQLSTDKLNYRYEHVAYSMLKGQKYEDIEQAVADGNELDTYILKIVMKMMKKNVFVKSPKF